MTALDGETRLTEVRRTDVTWSRVDDGFHVGSRAGEFVGYIDRQPDGRHRACDQHSREIGLFADLESAVRALSGDADRLAGVEVGA